MEIRECMISDFERIHNLNSTAFGYEYAAASDLYPDLTGQALMNFICVAVILTENSKKTS